MGTLGSGRYAPYAQRPHGRFVHHVEGHKQEATRLVPILDGTERVNITMLEAVFKSTFVQAAKGDHRSQKLVLEMARLNEKAKQQMKRDNTPIEEAIVLWGRNAEK